MLEIRNSEWRLPSNRYPCIIAWYPVLTPRCLVGSPTYTRAMSKSTNSTTTARGISTDGQSFGAVRLRAKAALIPGLNHNMTSSATTPARIISHVDAVSTLNTSRESALLVVQ
jgi:hypothetical protein